MMSSESRAEPSASAACDPRGITIHGGDYEHTQALAGKHAGIDVEYCPTANVNALFSQVLASFPHEVCEFSLANYLMLRGNGVGTLWALPIFPSRAFRHGSLVVRRDSPVHRLEQLTGLRIGVEDYSMSAAVWVRGLLRDECGIEPSSITWVSGRRQRFPPPPGVVLEFADGDVETLLLESRVDAIVGFSLRDHALPSAQRQLRTVLQDPESAERAYFKRSGIYPINHCVAVRRDVVEQRPGVIAAVTAAYVFAKRAAYQRRLGTTLVPWGRQHWARAFDTFDGDPLPYGLTVLNSRAIDTLSRYLREQDLVGEMPSPEALFLSPAGLENT
jgi:4,5-dihydroxyphthalate decarboxylase